MLKLMMADDDINMRFVLNKALSRYEEIKIVKEVATGQEAVSAFDDEVIDIAFLDVDMPGINGVEAAKLILDINPKCYIVFITAHDSYMQDAFSLYAFDYIVKPFKLERLHQTIERIIETQGLIGLVPREPVAELVEELMFRVKDGLVVVKKEDIILVERLNRQTIVVTKNGEFTINKTLQEVEAYLEGVDFMRSHKSYIIRLDAIESIHNYGRWTYIVKFRNTKHDALLTKEKAKWLEKKFSIL
jgi:two-component system LytT family response regulator